MAARRSCARFAVAVALLVVGCSGGDAIQATAVSSTESPGRTSVHADASSVTTAGHTQPPIGDARRPVIFDFSPTVSDLGALAFLASHPELRLVGVTLPGTGESHCEPGVAHTRGVLERLGLGDVPVGCGPEDPVTGFNAFPTSWRVQSDAIDLPEAAPNETRSAPRLIAELVRGEASPVEIVAVAPLTNLAVAFTEDPELADLLAGITIMGGAVDVAGNVFRNDVGEWNIWVDPTAAGIVFASGAAVTLVPLDATNDLPTSPIFFAALEDAGGTPSADLLQSVWRARPEWYENREGFFYFWDELAAAVLVDESLVQFETMRLVVDDDARDTKGWTRRDEAGGAIRVATSADRLAFESLFLRTLSGGPVELGYLEATPQEVQYFEEVAMVNDSANQMINAIFERVANDLGIRTAASEGEFLAIVAAALPDVFDLVLAGQAADIAGLVPPAGMDAAQSRLVASWDALLAARDSVIAVFAETQEFEVFESLISDVEGACLQLQSQVEIRLLDIDLACTQ